MTIVLIIMILQLKSILYSKDPSKIIPPINIRAWNKVMILHHNHNQRHHIICLLVVRHSYQINRCKWICYSSNFKTLKAYYDNKFRLPRIFNSLLIIVMKVQLIVSLISREIKNYSNSTIIINNNNLKNKWTEISSSRWTTCKNNCKIIFYRT